MNTINEIKKVINELIESLPDKVDKVDLRKKINNDIGDVKLSNITCNAIKKIIKDNLSNFKINPSDQIDYSKIETLCKK